MNQFISRLIAKSNGDEAALQPRSVGRFEFQPLPTFREEVEPAFDVSQMEMDDLRQRTSQRTLSNPASRIDSQNGDSPAVQSRPTKESVVPKRPDIPSPPPRVTASDSELLTRQASDESVEHNVVRHSEIIPSHHYSAAKITLPRPPEMDASQSLDMGSKSIPERVPDKMLHQAAVHAQGHEPTRLEDGALAPIGQRDGGRFSEVTPRDIGDRQTEHDRKPAMRLDIPESSNNVENTLSPSPEISPRRTSPEPAEDVRMNVIYPREQDSPAHEEAHRSRQEDPPAIHISIGKIEIRAVQPQPAVRDKKIEKRAPMLSLDDYLRQQREGRR